MPIMFAVCTGNTILDDGCEFVAVVVDGIFIRPITGITVPNISSVGSRAYTDMSVYRFGIDRHISTVNVIKYIDIPTYKHTYKENCYTTGLNNIGNIITSVLSRHGSTYISVDYRINDSAHTIRYIYCTDNGNKFYVRFGINATSPLTTSRSNNITCQAIDEAGGVTPKQSYTTASKEDLELELFKHMVDIAYNVDVRAVLAA